MRTWTSTVLCILVWMTTIVDLLAFQSSVARSAKKSQCKVSNLDDWRSLPETTNNDRNKRRDLLQVVGGISGSICHNNAVQALDQEITDCLLDLPPKPPNTVRLYLCRHGQTENNRLHLVQGSRVNPPLNSNGILMAERLGAVLCRIQQEKDDRQLLFIFHSPLLRAQQTAQIAASQFLGDSPPKLQVLDELVEIDFGPASEGQKEPRTNAMDVYTKWSLGQIDERPPLGESCREVLTRCASALSTILHSCQSNSNSKHFATGKSGGHIAAVAHSAYIRMFLALVQDTMLFPTAMMQRQANANINVLDIDMTAKVMRDANSELFGGSFLSQAPEDFSLPIPQSRVLRMNEICHLARLSIT